jgi:hypothetical protein
MYGGLPGTSCVHEFYQWQEVCALPLVIYRGRVPQECHDQACEECIHEEEQCHTRRLLLCIIIDWQ